MKLIGVGLHRTGTLSVKVALEKLGIGPVYHGFEFGGRPEHAALWLEAIDSDGDIDWNRIFGDYQVVMDWPMLGFWEQVVASYPDAKIILTERDPESWFDSHAALLTTIFENIADGTHPATAEMNVVMNHLVGEKFGPNGPLDRDHSIQIFKRHYEAVRATVSPDRVLSYHVRDGWEPLCQLFGVAVPDEPFPKVNGTHVAYENTKRAFDRASTTTAGIQWL